MRTKPSELRSAPVSCRYLKLVASLLFQSIEDGRNLLSVLVEDADLFVGQIVGIGLHLRDEILLDQRRRHGPERIEIDLGRLGLHDRRLAIDLADAGGVVGVDDPAFDRLDRRGRNVRDHVASSEIPAIGLQPDDIGLELLQARRGGHVEFGERCLVDDARLAEAVAGLEALDRRFDERIEHRSRPRDRIEIARGDEALAQRLHGFRFRSHSQFGAGRHGVPAAAGDEILILLDRCFRCIDGRRRQDRGRLTPDRHVRRRLIALRPFRLTAILFVGLGRDAIPAQRQKPRSPSRQKMRGARAARRSCHASIA